MKLAAKLAWEYRFSWLAMFVLAAASALVMIISSHVAIANETVAAQAGSPGGSIALDLYVAFLSTFLVVQTIAALCLESQARDLAIIKTCGASVRSIRWILIGEIIVITLAAYALATIVSFAIREPYVHEAIRHMSEPSNEVFGPDIGAFINAFVALFVAILFGSLRTIFKVSRQNVVSALHDKETVGRRKKPIGGVIIAVLATLVIIVTATAAFNSARIVDLVTRAVTDPEMIKLGVIPSVQGSLIMFPSMIFVAACMVMIGALASVLYRAILGSLARLLPAKTPGSVQVGVNLAKYNARKYYGAITPLVVFILVIVMIFVSVDGSTSPMLEMYRRNGVDITGMTDANYPVIAFILGPAIFIAFVGALCNIMMSGRNRIYTNRLTAILGVRPKELLLQGAVEMISYVTVAALLGLVVMLTAATLTQVAGAQITGVAQPYVVPWAWYFGSLGCLLIIVLLPAIAAVIRAKHLPSKAVLESFGE